MMELGYSQECIGKPNGLKVGYYIKPTIFGEVNNNMKIAKEEIFGPVLSIIPYKNIEDAIFIANDTEYGLAAYISGKDKEQLNYIARKLRAGQIHINYSSGGAYAPFGGYKQSEMDVKRKMGFRRVSRG